MMDWWIDGLVDMECRNKGAIATFAARSQSDRNTQNNGMMATPNAW